MINYFFFFGEIVFEENDNKESTNSYNLEFLDLLFEIFNYLKKEAQKDFYYIYLIPFFKSISGNDSFGGNKKGNAIKRYNWLAFKSNYCSTILDSLPHIYDIFLFVSYIVTLIDLSTKEKNISLEMDCFCLCKNMKLYLDNKDFKKEDLITFFSQKIYELMSTNNSTVYLILEKYNICKTLIELIDEEKEDKIKLKLIEFIHKILSANKEKYNCCADVNIRKETNDINLKINLILIAYENNDNKFNEKIMELIEVMNNFLKDKKIKECMLIINVIYTVINDYKFHKISNISDNILECLNNVLVQISLIFHNSNIDDLTDNGKELEELEIVFLNSILIFIYQLNMKNFDYKVQLKLERKRPIFSSKRIIAKKTLKDIINNLLMSQNHKVKKKAFEHLINFSIDEENKLIISSYILYIIIKIYYQYKNYKNLNKVFSILLNLVEDVELNAKILLNYDFITIAMDVLQELYIKNNQQDECYKTTFHFLEETCKYLNQELLMKYLNKLFFFFNKNVLSEIGHNKQLGNENSDIIEQRNNINIPNLYDNMADDLGSINSDDNGRNNIGRCNNLEPFDLDDDTFELETNINNKNNNEEEINNENEKNNDMSRICFDLLNLIKKYLKLNNDNYYDFIKNNKTNYIVISNHIFSNHLINNSLLLDNLKYSESKDGYMSFKIVLKINTYNEIKNFFLLKIMKDKDYIAFVINENQLEVKEKCQKKNLTLFRIEDFDKKLPNDNKYHICDIIFNIVENIFTFKIDDNEIIKESYKQFDFSSFKITIGFNADSSKANNLNSKLNIFTNKNKDKDKDNDINKTKKKICFIYISYLLIVNTLMDKEMFKHSIETERKYSPNPNIMTHYYRKRNRNYGKNIIAEIDFQNKNIELIDSNETKTNIKDEKGISAISHYIPYIKNTVLLNEDINDSYLFMISNNRNVYEYYSLNNLCELEKINKSAISSKIFDNYDINISLCNDYIFDFLIGFLFLIEKRFSELRNNEVNKNMYGGLINEEIASEYILIIFEIIMLIPSEKIKNNLFKGDDLSNSNIIKLKYFFYRNYSLLNNNEPFTEKILKIFSVENDDKEKNDLNKAIKFIKIITEVFLDPIFFEKLEFSIKNNILCHLICLLNKQEYKENEETNKCLNKLMKILFRIILYNKLSLNENDEGKTLVDLIYDCVQLIIPKLYPQKDIGKNDFLQKILNEINNISINYSKDIKQHLKSDISKYSYIFSLSNDEYMEESINLQIKNKEKQINKFLDLMNNYLKYEELKQCNFCICLKDLFNIKKDFIYEGFIYDKLYNNFFRNYYLNFGDSEIFENKKYAWFLSLKESYNKMQNKFFLKENHIKHFPIENPKSNKVAHYFKYDYGKEKYEKTFKEMNELAFIDKICDINLIDVIDNDNGKKNEKTYNCLIINKLHKILSIIILYDDYLCIYNNLCLDDKGKINVVFNETSHSLWTKDRYECKNELKEYIQKNEEAMKEGIYNIKIDDKAIQNKKDLSKFFYGKSYKFSQKKIYLKKINEIYKRQYLHISNSLEIFLKNGESYFIVLNTDNRDKLFYQIIDNIKDLYKDKDKDKENIMETIKNSKSNDKENYIYIKHFPYSYSLSQSQELNNINIKSKNKKKIFDYCKKIVDGNYLKEEICTEWTKNKINNYDYLMLLNILSGRSLNDLSQYFILPWIIKDFNKDIFNWLSDKSYRDLSLPIHACGEDKERIMNKYELLDDEKYHSGTFYSTHSFVCYFLIRVKPFTEIHLEIQGAKYDAPSRMFNGVEQLSNLTEKFQELIPQLFYLPELYIKINHIFEGDNEDNIEPIKDYILPQWSKNDPRKFVLMLKKIIENKKVSQNLNSWIDIIFGYKQKGPNAIKALNIYRNACYPPTKSELEKMSENKELEAHMYEKEELGCVGKQLFTKQHKNKDINIKNAKTQKIFFNDSEKLNQLKIKKIKEKKEDSHIIHSGKIGDIIFGINSPLNNNIKRSYYQGGISSLPSIMNYLREKYDKNIDNSDKATFMKKIESQNNYLLLNKNYKYSYKYNLIITFDSKNIEIINFIKEDAHLYFLDEIGDISCITINEKGDTLFVGFSNGKINQYKLEKYSIKENNNEMRYTNIPIFKCEENKNIYFNDKKNFNDYSLDDETKINLKLISHNNFTNNNPHCPKKIKLLSLNEFHNVLIALDELNLIYIISLNNNCKLMHVSHFVSNNHYNFKEILPLEWNGDFIIYSSYMVYLFSINGIPLCQLNLFEKKYQDFSSITCCKGVFLDDVILFTGHKDGSINIWKIINRNNNIKINEENPFINNKKKSKYLLPEYNYGYNSKHNRYNESKISEYELQRKFEQFHKISLTKDYSKNDKNYFIFMKMSNDLDYMILIDNKRNLYLLTNVEEINKKSTFSKRHKNKCINCNKIIIGEGMKPTFLSSNNLTPDKLADLSEYLFNENEKEKEKEEEKEKVKEKDKKVIICEDCKEKVKDVENYLYDF